MLVLSFFGPSSPRGVAGLVGYAYISKRYSRVLDGNVPEDEDDDYILDENFDEDESLGPVNPF